jgi:hypothetical protein
MHKKIGLFLMFFFFVFRLWAQDFSIYRAVSLDWIDELVKDKIGGEALTIWDQNQRFIVDLDINNYPIPINDEYLIRAIQFYSDYLGYSDLYGQDFFIRTFSHYFTYSYNNKNYVFCIQNILVESFKQDVRLGDKVKLYIMLGMYNDFGNNFFIFVNEFMN